MKHIQMLGWFVPVRLAAVGAARWRGATSPQPDRVRSGRGRLPHSPLPLCARATVTHPPAPPPTRAPLPPRPVPAPVAQAECPTCRCRPSDIEASWDTRQEWASSPGGGGAASSCTAQLGGAAHARAAQHYAHLLQEARWATTPPDAVAALAALATP